MFTGRSQEKELLDLGPAHYSSDEYQHCLKMLFRINQLLGFLRDTLKLLQKFPRHFSLLDIGCGSGLFLLRLSRSLPAMKLMGTDISAAAIQLANQRLALQQTKNSAANVSFQLQEKPALELPLNSVDILLATLMCHHLSDEELIIFLTSALATARHAVIINDLHRHRLAEWLYKMVSPLFRNRLISHDGLISIRRGFKRKEWLQLLQKSGIQHYQINWRFPFRWQIILWKK